MTARIYQPAKTAMSSGRRKTKQWLLEMDPGAPKIHDPLMGWLGSGDTDQQVQIRFPTKEAAIAFAENKGLDYRVYEPRERVVQPKSYAENFVRKI